VVAVLSYRRRHAVVSQEGMLEVPLGWAEYKVGCHSDEGSSHKRNLICVPE
jgi:hypothetical protein